MGDNHYDRYVAHLARHQPGTTPMDRGAFHRERMDQRERNPMEGGGCC
jgi:uncharacterized short protein YbdD (DUF466 family)